MFRENLFEDEVAIVTSATGGIGWETSKLIGKLGADVAITDRNPERLSELESTLDGNVYAHRADLTSERARDNQIRGGRETLNRPTALINGMGTGSGGRSVAELDPDEVVQLMTVNYTATALLTSRVYRGM